MSLNLLKGRSIMCLQMRKKLLTMLKKSREKKIKKKVIKKVNKKLLKDKRINDSLIKRKT